MADKDLTAEGVGAEDPDHMHAPLAQTIAGLPPADDVTKARHLRTALKAFADLPRYEFTNPDHPTNSSLTPSTLRLRPYRTLGAVAAAALVIFGFGALLPLLSPSGGSDSDSTAMDSAAATLFVISEDEPAEMRAESALSESAPAAAPAQRLFNLTGLCNAEIEALTYREPGISSWVAFEIIEDGTAVLIVKASIDELTNLDQAAATVQAFINELTNLDQATATAQDASQSPTVTLILDPGSCDLLRVERAGP